MADRYWVGGSGNWDATTTTNWSATSGGAGGASAPTSVDDVFFDAGSDAGGIFTVTIGTAAVCRDITAGSLDFVMTLAGTLSPLIYGSMLLPATNFTSTNTGGYTFLATTTGKTITTNGVTLAGAVFNGNGGEWTLGSALTLGSSITHALGTLRTANFNVSCGSFICNSNTTRALYLGSSIFSINGNTISFTSTNLTLDVGTSQINITAASPTFAGGDLTYNNVSFTSTAAGTVTITGANTFNNLTFTSPAATGLRNISVGANQTVNGTLTFGTANTAIRRMFVRTDATGTARTITAATVVALSDVDFRYITGAGTGTWSGTRLGNCMGNSGITFNAGKTVYRVGTGNWSATQWALTSGGVVDVNNFPLAQDIVIFDANTVTGTHTIDAAWNIGTFDASAITSAITIATGSTPSIYGDMTLSSNITTSGTGTITFSIAGGTQNLTSAGRAFTQNITVNVFAGTLRLNDALTVNAQTGLIAGALDLNGFDITTGTFFGSASIARSIAFGDNVINITGNSATVLNIGTATNFTYTGTPTINVTNSGGVGTRNINLGNAAGGSEVNALDINITAGTDECRQSGHFRNINFTGFSGTTTETLKTVYGDFIFSATMSTLGSTSSITFAKSSGVQTVTTNGVVINCPINKSSTGDLRILDDLTLGSTRSFILTQGTLDLNGFNLTCSSFSSSNSNTRSIAFGNNVINVTGSNGGVVAFNTATNYTYTGTATFNLTYAGSTGTRTVRFGSTAGGSEAGAPNINVIAGSDIVDIATYIRDVNFTGFSGSTGTTAVRITGNVIYSTGMTVSASENAVTFEKSTGTQTLITNGKTLDFPINKFNAGTLQFLDNVSVSTTRTINHTGGAIDLNDFNLTTGLYSSTGSTARQLDLGTGRLTNSGATFTVSGSNFTTAGTGTIDMTSSSSKTFAGGGVVYPFTLNQGGTGTLTITGANTFADITNTVQPCTITFPAGQVTSVQDFSVTGTAGNLVTLNSSTPGTRWTIAKV